MNTTWAVQPATWQNFDESGCVYCADIDTAYKIASQQRGEQMIFRINNNTKPIKWVRVTDGEVAHNS